MALPSTNIQAIQTLRAKSPGAPAPRGKEPDRCPVQKGVRRDLYFSSSCKALDEKDHTAEFVVNTIQADRDDEIVLPLAVLASKDSYMANPVFLWGHAWHGDPEKALGICLDLSGDASQVVAKFRYDVEIHQTAATVWKQVAKGTVRAVSIGFLPKKWVGAWSPPEEIDALPPGVAEALRSGRIWLVHTEVELVEISQVLIPSNRGALAASAGSRSDQLVEHLVKLLEGLNIKSGSAADPEPPVAQVYEDEPQAEAYPVVIPEVVVADPEPAESGDVTPAPVIEAAVPTEEPATVVVEDEAKTVTVSLVEWDAMKSALAEATKNHESLLLEHLIARL